MGKYDSAENPFDLLPLSSQIRRENYLVGLLPWLMVTIIEWFFLYMALSLDDPRHLILPLILEVLLLPAVLGYFAQIHTIRTFENLGRQIRFDEISLTEITGKDMLDWLLGMNRRVYLQGAVANVVLGLVPILIVLWNYARELPAYYTFTVLVIYLIKDRFINNRRFSVFSACLGFVYLFRIKGYFRSRAVGLLIVLIFRVAFVILTLATSLILAGIITTLIGMYSVRALESIQSVMHLFFACMWIAVELPLIAWIISRSTKRNRPRAEAAIQSWLRGEESGGEG